MLAAELPIFPPIVEKIKADMILQFYSINRYRNEVVNQFLVLSAQSSPSIARLFATIFSATDCHVVSETPQRDLS